MAENIYLKLQIGAEWAPGTVAKLKQELAREIKTTGPAGAGATTAGQGISSITKGMEAIDKGSSKAARSIGSVGKGISDLKSPIGSVAVGWDNMGRSIENAVKRMLVWGTAMRVIYGAVGAVKEMVGVIAEVETSMLKLQSVMNPITTNFEQLRTAAATTSTEFGIRIQDALKSMQVFAEQGREMADVINLTRTSMLASNVTTMSVSEATELLTAAMRQFRMEASSSVDILDVWRNVASKYGYSAKEMALGTQRAGTAAAEVGISFEQLQAILAATGAVAKDSGEKIGTALTFMFAKIRMPATIKAFEDLGIAVKLNNKDFRSAWDILSETGEKWNELSDTQQMFLAKSVGGGRRYKTFLDMMGAFSNISAATTDAYKSQDAAIKANEIAMQGLQKQMAALKSEWDGLGVAIGEAGILDVLKGIVGGVSAVVKALGAIPKGAMTALVGVTGAALGLGAATAIGKTAISYVAPRLGGGQLAAALAGMGLGIGGIRSIKAEIPERFGGGFAPATQIPPWYYGAGAMRQTMARQPFLTGMAGLAAGYGLNRLAAWSAPTEGPEKGRAPLWGRAAGVAGYAAAGFGVGAWTGQPWGPAVGAGVGAIIGVIKELSNYFESASEKAKRYSGALDEQVTRLGAGEKAIRVVGEAFATPVSERDIEWLKKYLSAIEGLGNEFPELIGKMEELGITSETTAGQFSKLIDKIKETGGIPAQTALARERALGVFGAKREEIKGDIVAIAQTMGIEKRPATIEQKAAVEKGMQEANKILRDALKYTTDPEQRKEIYKLMTDLPKVVEEGLATYQRGWTPWARRGFGQPSPPTLEGLREATLGKDEKEAGLIEYGKMLRAELSKEIPILPTIRMKEAEKYGGTAMAIARLSKERATELSQMPEINKKYLEASNNLEKTKELMEGMKKVEIDLSDIEKMAGVVKENNAVIFTFIDGLEKAELIIKNVNGAMEYSTIINGEVADGFDDIEQAWENIGEAGKTATQTFSVYDTAAMARVGIFTEEAKEMAKLIPLYAELNKVIRDAIAARATMALGAEIKAAETARMPTERLHALKDEIEYTNKIIAAREKYNELFREIEIRRGGALTELGLTNISKITSEFIKSVRAEIEPELVPELEALQMAGINRQIAERAALEEKAGNVLERTVQQYEKLVELSERLKAPELRAESLGKIAEAQMATWGAVGRPTRDGGTTYFGAQAQAGYMQDIAKQQIALLEEEKAKLEGVQQAKSNLAEITAKTLELEGKIADLRQSSARQLIEIYNKMLGEIRSLGLKYGTATQEEQKEMKKRATALSEFYSKWSEVSEKTGERIWSRLVEGELEGMPLKERKELVQAAEELPAEYGRAFLEKAGETWYEKGVEGLGMPKVEDVRQKSQEALKSFIDAQKTLDSAREKYLSTIDRNVEMIRGLLDKISNQAPAAPPTAPPTPAAPITPEAGGPPMPPIEVQVVEPAPSDIPGQAPPSLAPTGAPISIPSDIDIRIEDGAYQKDRPFALDPTLPILRPEQIRAPEDFEQTWKKTRIGADIIDKGSAEDISKNIRSAIEEGIKAGSEELSNNIKLAFDDVKDIKLQVDEPESIKVEQPNFTIPIEKPSWQIGVEKVTQPIPVEKHPPIQMVAPTAMPESNVSIKIASSKDHYFHATIDNLAEAMKKEYEDRASKDDLNEVKDKLGALAHDVASIVPGAATSVLPRAAGAVSA